MGRCRRDPSCFRIRTEAETIGQTLDRANSCGLRHKPANEQGVVLLFGMLAKELGYLIEAVQNGFPDCEAKRQIGPERWQQRL